MYKELLNRSLKELEEYYSIVDREELIVFVHDNLGQLTPESRGKLDPSMVAHYLESFSRYENSGSKGFISYKYLTETLPVQTEEALNKYLEDSLPYYRNNWGDIVSICYSKLVPTRPPVPTSKASSRHIPYHAIYGAAILAEKKLFTDKEINEMHSEINTKYQKFADSFIEDYNIYYPETVDVKLNHIKKIEIPENRLDHYVGKYYLHMCSWILGKYMDIYKNFSTKEKEKFMESCEKDPSSSALVFSEQMENFFKNYYAYPMRYANASRNFYRQVESAIRNDSYRNGNLLLYPNRLVSPISPDSLIKDLPRILINGNKYFIYSSFRETASVHIRKRIDKRVENDFNSEDFSQVLKNEYNEFIYQKYGKI